MEQHDAKRIGFGLASISRDSPISIKLVKVIVLLIVLVISFKPLSDHFSSPETYKSTIATLDSKKETVLVMTGAAAISSAFISAIPDDACTPIADRLANISTDFGIVLGAILLEKYLLTTLGFAFFSVVVPICCLMAIASIVVSDVSPFKQLLPVLAVKLLVIGLIIWGSVPASSFITEKIEKTYQISMDEAIEAAEQTAEVVEEAQENSSTDEGFIESLQSALRSAGDAIGSAATKISNAPEWAKHVLSNFVEAFTIMVVTSLIIPILVPLSIMWVLKLMFQQQVIQAPSVHLLPPSGDEIKNR